MKTKLLLWLMGTRLYRFLLKYVIPEITLFHGTGPNWITKKAIRDNMRAGDVLLSKSAFHLTNILIGGKYSHAAVVLGRDEIAEMTARGFDINDVNGFCKGTTGIVLLRFKDDPTGEYGKKVAEKTMELSYSDYDLNFDLSNDVFYCSELFYVADYEKRGGFDLSDLIGAGKPYLSPLGIYEATGLNIIYEWKDTL